MAIYNETNTQSANRVETMKATFAEQAAKGFKTWAGIQPAIEKGGEKEFDFFVASIQAADERFWLENGPQANGGLDLPKAFGLWARANREAFLAFRATK